MQTCTGSKRQQHVKTEVLPHTLDEFGDSGLRDAQPFCRFRLAPALGFEMLLKTNHDLSTQRHDFRLGRIKAQVNKNVTTARSHAGIVPAGIGFFHWLAPICLYRFFASSISSLRVFWVFF